MSPSNRKEVTHVKIYTIGSTCAANIVSTGIVVPSPIRGAGAIITSDLYRGITLSRCI